MAYKLAVTEHADELLDHILHYLIYRLKNKQAAMHLLDELDKLYDRLEENPNQFPLSGDKYLADVFNIAANVVNVVGIFHRLENYRKKI